MGQRAGQSEVENGRICIIYSCSRRIYCLNSYIFYSKFIPFKGLLLSFYVFIKKRHRPLPSQFGGCGVKTWCGVVVEAVLRAGVNVGGV
jgi:hypothetical protein